MQSSITSATEVNPSIYNRTARNYSRRKDACRLELPVNWGEPRKRAGEAMWTRRKFLQHTSVALATMTCLRAQAAQSAGPRKGPLGKPVGLQIYTVREAAAKDFAGTLKAIGAMGYGEVELAG